MKMMRKALGVVCGAAALLLSASPAHAWDELGHRVVARIAWDQMTPAARARAVQLLNAAPALTNLRALMPTAGPMEARQREWFTWAAVWPDIVRDRNLPSNVYAHSDWHYVNFFWEQRPGGTRADRDDVPRAGELINQLARISRTLADPAVPDSAKAVDMAWALHLVGDGHQPLHNSARITAALPEGDRGGNLFLLAGPYPYSNLHAYWDALVGLSVPWARTTRTEDEYVAQIAGQIQRQYPPSAMRRQLLPGEFERWSREGLRVAQNVAYATPEKQRPSMRYRRVAWDAAEPRIALAGYRLANLLNGALDPR